MDSLYTSYLTPASTLRAVHQDYYGSPSAQLSNKIRFKDLLTHPNPLLSNQTWGHSPSVVYAIETENESFGGFPNEWVDIGLTCSNANFIRHFIDPSILISTGGSTDLFSSSVDAYFLCPSIDLVSIHDFDAKSSAQALQNVAAKAARFGKLILGEEIGCPLNGVDKNVCEEAMIKAYETAGIPWLVKSSLDSFIDWPTLSAHASKL